MADLSVTPLFNVPINTSVQVPAPTAIDFSGTPRIAGSLGYEERNPRHQGVQGVARDVLGTIGDFLLTRLRLPAMYGPAQEQRKLREAMADINTDPLGAIDRVTSVNYAAGAKLRDQVIDNQRLEAARAQTAEDRARRLSIAQDAQNERTRNRVAAMLGTMATWDDNKRISDYPKLLSQALNYAKANNLDLTSELPDAFDSVLLDSFIDGSVPVGTQRAQRLTRERAEQIAAHQAKTEEQGDAKIAETGQHHRKMEEIGQTNAETARQRAATYAKDVAKKPDKSNQLNNKLPPGGKILPDGRYQVTLPNGEVKIFRRKK